MVIKVKANKTLGDKIILVIFKTYINIQKTFQDFTLNVQKQRHYRDNRDNINK